MTFMSFGLTRTDRTPSPTRPLRSQVGAPRRRRNIPPPVWAKYRSPVAANTVPGALTAIDRTVPPSGPDVVNVFTPATALEIGRETTARTAAANAAWRDAWLTVVTENTFEL